MNRNFLFCMGAIACLSGCGLNPFGPGAQGGLDLYAHFAKTSERPKAINEEENGKNGANGLVKEGASAAGRLAKGAAGTAVDSPWIVARGLRSSLDTLIYWEDVRNKPSEEDAEKLMTGRGEVKFRYGGLAPDSLIRVDTTLITDVFSFHFLGRENKTWKTSGGSSEIDSLDVEVNFSSTSIINIRPGKTRFWARNISSRDDLGAGDSAFFSLDSLNDSIFTQYGRGEFLDAHSGKENAGAARPFHFDIRIIHKNSLGGNPYLRYQDNEGILNFILPWGERGNDSLYFEIHFMPNYQRDGVIRKGGPQGSVLVEFNFNEKTGVGTVIYRNENGEEIGYEKT